MAMPPPTLQTTRLILRPFNLADAPAIQHLAGNRAVAASTLSIPHPYPDGVAETWIRTHPEQFTAGKAVIFAILQTDHRLCGSIELMLTPEFQLAELGYWIGVPFWGRGYCTEAAQRVIEYGFEDLNLNRIQGTHYTDNPASGRVMVKLGMAYEGCRRQHTRKDGAFKDINLYGLLRQDWSGPGTAPGLP